MTNSALMSVGSRKKDKSVKTVVTTPLALAEKIAARAAQTFRKPPQYFRELAVADLQAAGLLGPVAGNGLPEKTNGK